MSKIKSVSWVNTPVLIEAIIRYKEKRLSKSMKLWIEKLLEITPNERGSCLTDLKNL